jgi:hypothetical protein
MGNPDGTGESPGPPRLKSLVKRVQVTEKVLRIRHNVVSEDKHESYSHGDGFQGDLPLLALLASARRAESAMDCVLGLTQPATPFKHG